VTAAPLRRRPDALSRRSLDAVVILPGPPSSPNGEPIVLAGIGAAAWQLLAEWRTADAIVAVITAAGDTDADVSTLDHEVAALLDRLERAGALERAEERLR
jgi:hypothetical protein